jgi:alpha-L-fucosidase
MSVGKPDSVLPKLIDTVSKGGFYLLNIAPMADGTIPQAQQDTLLAIGRWLDVNGEAIYGTRPWRQFGEGGAQGFRFTTKKDALYAISLGWPGKEAVITSLGSDAGKVTAVSLLGHSGALAFKQDATGLRITLPASPPANVSYAYSFKISGSVAKAR